MATACRTISSNWSEGSLKVSSTNIRITIAFQGSTAAVSSGVSRLYAIALPCSLLSRTVRRQLKWFRAHPEKFGSIVLHTVDERRGGRPGELRGRGRHDQPPHG